MNRYRVLTNEWKLTARSLRVVCEAVTRSVRVFADEGRVRFRGRRLGQEAWLNVAAWYFADLSRAEQERLLTHYLPRLESYLLAGGTAPADDPPGDEDAPFDEAGVDSVTARKTGRGTRAV